MTTIIRDYEEGQRIPDEQDSHVWYTYEELDGAEFVESNDITGAEVYHLTNGKIAFIQSIDLDWVAPYDDKFLRTVSYDKQKEVEQMTPEDIINRALQRLKNLERDRANGMYTKYEYERTLAQVVEHTVLQAINSTKVEQCS